MFDFRLFPGTNFNRINLDWILAELGILKEGQDAVEEAAEQATEAATEATQAAVDASQAAADAVEAINTVTNLAQSAVNTAEQAKSIANNANSTASDARSAANSAQGTAQGAQNLANSALSTATGAHSIASQAQTAANNAQTAAGGAQATADANAALITALGTPHTWTDPDNANEKWTWWEIGKLRVAFGENKVSYGHDGEAVQMVAGGSVFRTNATVVYAHPPFAFTAGKAALAATQVQWAVNPGVNVNDQVLQSYFCAGSQAGVTPTVHFVFVALAP